MNKTATVSWRTRTMTALAAAVLAATGALAVATPAQALDNAAIGSGATVLAIEYEHPNFNGAQLIVLSNATGCTLSTTDIDISSSSLGFWDNQISSHRVFGGGSPLVGCLVSHFDLTPFGGTSSILLGSNPVMNAAIDNRTSSVLWT